MKMTLMQHFAELRRRILWVALIFILAFCFGWVVAPNVEVFLTAPLLNAWDDASLLYTGITDGLMIQFSLATMIALIITVPVFLWHVWAYIAPGLHKNEKQFLVPIFLISPLLFVIGAAFAFYVLFPFAFKFFLEINESANFPVVLLPAVTGYLAFAIGMLKVFGIAFQMPLVLVGLNRIGVLSRKTAIQSRKYVIVLIFIMAAVLTPPDVISQILLALPMLLLFELSILFMKKDS
ncbi:MAG: twin-arginine translocase subunit TatC [Alphaproteobacteria bacterium]|nr:twin-arginine translocase subunit TatC [Alphaproteobacteria bacterium]MBR6010565.1 twin-arginine translocase subunit TatC [Alphaproteobacteria bacterium]